MKEQKTLLCAAIGACLLFFSACFKPPKDFDPRDGNNVYTGCRVKSIDGLPFAYNQNNDPVSLVRNGQAGTGNPSFYFKYDKKGRLVEYISLFSETDYGFRHRYGYNGNQNRITTDTMYFMGGTEFPDLWASRSIYYPTYDNLNRVVKDSVVTTGYPGTNTGYTIASYPYNEEGNLANGYSFDNKMNPHRTNKVWMFIDRNYSVNNPVAAVRYNTVGLPLSYANKSAATLVFNFNTYVGATNIDYDCK
ncbi:MAG: hypothetical protein ABIU63_17600 [Chitinophagaceae bacterium]